MERVVTHVAMAAEVLQQLNLTQSALSENLFAEDIRDLLDSDTLASLVVHGRTIKEGESSSVKARFKIAWRGNKEKQKPQQSEFAYQTIP